MLNLNPRVRRRLYILLRVYIKFLRYPMKQTRRGREFTDRWGLCWSNQLKLYESVGLRSSGLGKGDLIFDMNWQEFRKFHCLFNDNPGKIEFTIRKSFTCVFLSQSQRKSWPPTECRYKSKESTLEVNPSTRWHWRWPDP